MSGSDRGAALPVGAVSRVPELVVGGLVTVPAVTGRGGATQRPANEGARPTRHVGRAFSGAGRLLGR